MAKCSIKNCSSRISSSGRDLKSKIYFYKFPPRGIKRKQWVDACGEKRLKVNARSVICSKHFETTQFKWTPNGLVLSPAVIPTLNLPTKSHEELCQKRMRKIPIHELESINTNDEQFNILCNKSKFHYFVLNPTNILEETKKIVEKSNNLADYVLDIAVKNTLSPSQIGVSYLNPHEKVIQQQINLWLSCVEMKAYIDTPLSYKCYLCNNFWWHLEEFREHLFSHPIMIISTVSFNGQTSIIAYNNITQFKDDILDKKCPKCGNDLTNLKNRSKLHCPSCISDHCNIRGKKMKNIGDFECNICARYFETEENFDEHLNDFHDVRSDLPILNECFTCKFCDARYPNGKNHYCLSRGSLASCTYCFRNFVDSSYQEQHMKNNQENYICKICDIELAANCLKIEHMLTHSNKYTIVKKCTLCKDIKAFISSDGAALHLDFEHRDFLPTKESYFCTIIIPKSCINRKCRQIYNESNKNINGVTENQEKNTNLKNIDYMIPADHIETEIETLDEEFCDPETSIIALNEPSKKVQKSEVGEDIINEDDNMESGVIILEVESDEDIYDENPETGINLNEPSKNLHKVMLSEHKEDSIESGVEILEDESYEDIYDENPEIVIDLNQPSKKVHKVMLSEHEQDSIESGLGILEVEGNEDIYDENPETGIDLNEPSKKVDNDRVPEDNKIIHEVDNIEPQEEILEGVFYEVINDENSDPTMDLNESSNFNEAELPIHNDISEDEPEDYVDDIIILDFGTDAPVENIPVEEDTVTIKAVVPEIEDKSPIQLIVGEKYCKIAKDGVKTVLDQNKVKIDTDKDKVFEAFPIKNKTEQDIKIHVGSEDNVKVIDVNRDEYENTHVRGILVEDCKIYCSTQPKYKWKKCYAAYKSMKEYLAHFINTLQTTYELLNCSKCHKKLCDMESLNHDVDLHNIYGCHGDCKIKIRSALVELENIYEHLKSHKEIVIESSETEDTNNTNDSNYVENYVIKETKIPLRSKLYEFAFNLNSDIYHNFIRSQFGAHDTKMDPQKPGTNVISNDVENEDILQTVNYSNEIKDLSKLDPNQSSSVADETIPLTSNFDVETLDTVDNEYNPPVSWDLPDRYDEVENKEKIDTSKSFIMDTDDPMLSKVDGIRREPQETNQSITFENKLDIMESFDDVFQEHNKETHTMDSEDVIGSNNLLVENSNILNSIFMDITDSPLQIEDTNLIETDVPNMTASAEKIKDEKPEIKPRKTKTSSSKSPKPIRCDGKKHKYIFCSLFSERRRRKLCNYFWSLASAQREKYILSHVEQEPKDPVTDGRKRDKKRKYFFDKHGFRIRGLKKILPLQLKRTNQVCC